MTNTASVMNTKDTQSPFTLLSAAASAGNVPVGQFYSSDGTSLISLSKVGASYLKLKDTCRDLSELKSWEYEKGTQTLILDFSSGQTIRYPRTQAQGTLTGQNSTASPTVSESSLKPGSMISVETIQAPKEVMKYDDGKARLDLLPPEPLIEISEVLAFGARKYAPYGWAKGMSYSRLYGAAMRHLWSWWMGENYDPESGKSHLAHAACCILFAMQYRSTRPEYDDRPIEHYKKNNKDGS